MNLFENLQHLNESNVVENSKTLTERSHLNVGEYNKLKQAMNKDNVLKQLFVIHPGEIEVRDYKLLMSVYGAFKEFEHTQPANRFRYSGRGDDIKNDEATRNGIGKRLYTVRVNLIDENIVIKDDYYVKDEITRYISRIQSEIEKYNYMDVPTVIEKIMNAIEASKESVKEVLLSKNFIYNLTGKSTNKDTKDTDYNLDLENTQESTQLTEDFDPSMPDWLKRAIKLNNSNKSYGHNDLNYNMNFDTLKWVVEPFPQKGKLADIVKNEYYAMLIDASGDRQDGDYIVYFPAAYIGHNEQIEVNGRNRNIDAMSIKALAPYVKEFAHAIDSAKDRQERADKNRARAQAQAGSINRVDDDSRYNYPHAKIIDKSGYIVDPNKYKRLLAQLKSSEYADRLNDLFVVITDLRTKFKEFMSSDNILPNPDSKDYSYTRRAQFDKASKAFKYYNEAIDNYQDATKTLENIKDAKTNSWGDEAYSSFNKTISAAENNVVACLNIIESKEN